MPQYTATTGDDQIYEGESMQAAIRACVEHEGGYVHRQGCLRAIPVACVWLEGGLKGADMVKPTLEARQDEIVVAAAEIQRLRTTITPGDIAQDLWALLSTDPSVPMPASVEAWGAIRTGARAAGGEPLITWEDFRDEWDELRDERLTRAEEAAIEERDLAERMGYRVDQA